VATVPVRRNQAVFWTQLQDRCIPLISSLDLPLFAAFSRFASVRSGVWMCAGGFRAGRRGSLEVDGYTSSEQESGGLLTGLNTSGNLYIGSSSI